MPVKIGYNPYKCNWEQVKKKAKTMTKNQLHGAIADCKKSIAKNVPNAGMYMDQITIYQRVLDNRNP